MSKVQNVFLVGAKSLGAYGGYETFVYKLTEYHQNNPNIKYHVACKANGDGCMDETKLDNVKRISDSEFEFHNARCFKIHIPQIGPAQAIYYDVAALRECCKYIKKNNIENPIVYIMACRIGPFARYFYMKIHKLGGKVWNLILYGDINIWMFLERKLWKMNDKIIKAINYLFHPQKLLIRIKWKVFSRKLKYVGKGTWVGKNFSIKGAEYISIKNDFIGGINLKLHAYDSHCGKHLNTIPQIIIGNNVTFTDGVYISSINKVEIEDGVLCGGNVFITDNFHGKSEVDELDIRPNDRLLYAPHEANFLKLDCSKIKATFGWRPRWHIDECMDMVCICKEWSRIKPDYSSWRKTCGVIYKELHGHDDKNYNDFVRKISGLIGNNSVITTDVGQNQVWVAQSFDVKDGQRILFSGGHGAMGYSLPAAIGACIGSGKRTYCFTGDGGLQMNIQELQFINREKLPITIILFNNNALGMIRHFQEMYFHDNYYQTVPSGGYDNPDFEKLSKAYGFDYKQIKETDDNISFDIDKPTFIEVVLNDKTYVFPKLEFGKPNQDQEPLLDRKLFNKLMEL